MGILDFLTDPKLVATALSAGIQGLSTLQSSKDTRASSEENAAIARDRLAEDQRQFDLNRELALQQLMLNAQEAARANQVAAARAEIEKQRVIQEAFGRLINAGLTGAGQEQNALASLTTSVQNPLLNVRRI